MSTGWIILIVAVALLGIAAAFAPAYLGGGGRVLRRRFGPEYERTVAAHGGDQHAAEKELEERLREHGKLQPKPLAEEQRERYAAEWSRLQEHFVFSPAESVAAADRLLGSVLRDRGFPESGYDDQVAALSVREPRHVSAYREVHSVADERRSSAGTEELRQALLRARDLFDRLVDQRGPVSHNGGDRTGPARRLVERINVPWPGRQHQDTSKGATS